MIDEHYERSQGLTVSPAAILDNERQLQLGMRICEIWDKHPDLDLTLGEAAKLAAIPSMTPAAVNKIREFEQHLLTLPQTPIVTHHLIHAGMYHRTIMMPAGTSLTGALIKRATTVTVSGDALVFTGETVRLTGYHVIPASEDRKQAFLALADTHITMSFATDAKTVEECEAEFTDEAELLGSRCNENVVVITGE